YRCPGTSEGRGSPAWSARGRKNSGLQRFFGHYHQTKLYLPSQQGSENMIDTYQSSAKQTNPTKRKQLRQFQQGRTGAQIQYAAPQNHPNFYQLHPKA